MVRLKFHNVELFVKIEDYTVRKIQNQGHSLPLTTFLPLRKTPYLSNFIIS